MKIRTAVSVAIVIAGMAGCKGGISQPPTIDATSDQTMESSLHTVRESMPDAEKQKFDEAYKLVVASGLDMKQLFTGGIDEAGLKQSFKNKVHGKTGAEIIASAEQLLAEREAEEKRQALQEIKELEEKRSALSEAAKKLEGFRVERSRFSISKSRYSTMGTPVIELTVKNETAHPVSRAYFAGVLASPGRSVPWLEKDFNYSIPGGIEPGESATWKLQPNTFEWNVDAPDDAILTVTVERLDGADGEPIAKIERFTEKDEKRLLELKDKYSK